MRPLQLFIQILVFMWGLLSCNQKETVSVVFKQDENILSINRLFLADSDSLVFNMPLVLPLTVSTSDSTLVIYDFANESLKQFFLNSSQRALFPLQDGPNKIKGEFFKGVGLIKSTMDSVLIGTNEAISFFNFEKQKFSAKASDEFPHCVSFNSPINEIFFQRIGEEDLLISQNGDPCYDLGDLSKSVTLENFKQKKFVRIVSSQDEIVYTLKLPDLKLNNLYERFSLKLTYNEDNGKFYAMLNPLTYLFEYEINDRTFEFELTNYWNLNLKYSELPVDYFIEEVINPEISNKALDYNFEINFLDAIEHFVFVSYAPSKDLAFENPQDAPYSAHYLVAILDLKNGKIKTISLNYDEFQFYGVSNGLLWIYDVASSEKSGFTIFKFLEIEKIM